MLKEILKIKKFACFTNEIIKSVINCTQTKDMNLNILKAKKTK